MNVFKNLIRKANKTKFDCIKRTLHSTQYLGGFLDCSAGSQLNKHLADRYMCLPIPEPKTQVCYVWIDGTGIDLRMRTRTLDFVPSIFKDCPNWSFDGGCALFDPSTHPDYYIVPIAMYPDPFRRGKNKIVLCETFTNDKKPSKTNHRQGCIDVLNRVCDHEVNFGFEQEFYYMLPDGKPYGWPCGSKPDVQGKNYVGVGAQRIPTRDITECIYRCCLYAGIDIYGTQAERGYGQWEILTGPTLSIKAADDLWMVRFIASRVAEDFGLYATFKAIPIKYGVPSGLHTNISTKRTRDDGGLKTIHELIKKLEKNHKKDITHYDCSGGDHTKKRLTGQNHTCQMDNFKVGEDKKASIKIPPNVIDKKKGFFKDRRPSACADPYAVMATIIKSCLL